MRFKLTNNKSFFNKEKSEDMKYMNSLKKLGFGVFKEDDKEFYLNKEKKPFVEIHKLEELMDFIKNFGEIVLTSNVIEIYDDYRE